MNRIMKLNPKAFESVKDGSKIFEIRLNDEKRKLIEVGDHITFQKLPSLEEDLLVVVKDILKEKTFEKLFSLFPPSLAGWEENSSPKKCATDMRKYYSKEEERRNGVVAIKIELVN